MFLFTLKRLATKNLTLLVLGLISYWLNSISAVLIYEVNPDKKCFPSYPEATLKVKRETTPDFVSFSPSLLNTFKFLAPKPGANDKFMKNFFQKTMV